MNRKERRAQGARGPAPDKIVLAYCYNPLAGVSESFHASHVATLLHEIKRTGAAFGSMSKQAGTGNVAHVRNILTEQFLATDADWLWFVDTDMGFAPWTLQRLLGAADKTERPIVGGLCFAMSLIDASPENGADIYESFPTVGVWNRNDDGQIIGWRYLTEYPEDTVCKVDTSGAACVLIHRTVLETIGGSWWSHIQAPAGAMGVNQRELFGEDVSFFMRCADHDIPVWLDTMVKTSHHKGGIYLTHEQYQEQEAIKAAKEKVRAETVFSAETGDDARSQLLKDADRMNRETFLGYYGNQG